ncbi:ATPase [Candidatus Gracilibacteria bacterium]|nr:ATPase [Candidatus Gracilibacteria bacterium]
MTQSCHIPEPKKQEAHACCAPKKKTDWLLWFGITAIGLGLLVALLPQYISFFQTFTLPSWLSHFAMAEFELLKKMAWGIALGILFVGLLDKVPREFVTSLLGKGGSFSGIMRATGAGVLLDLCSHGILMVGMKLYERGASLGQVMAFLIASPWNSFSLTLILWALVGFKWMMAFLLLSMVIAVISGLVFEKLVAKGILPQNPNRRELPNDFHFFREGKAQLKRVSWNGKFFGSIITDGFKGSRMVLRWVFLGVVLASLLRTFVTPENFQALFGPSIAGLGLTVLFATILEVCSEGSTPIAADILTKAKAPGNSFAFLMTGVSTDYTEVMSLKDTTKSWKIALFLPLVTVPQVLILAWILNQVGGSDVHFQSSRNPCLRELNVV